MFPPQSAYDNPSSRPHLLIIHISRPTINERSRRLAAEREARLAAAAAAETTAAVLLSYPMKYSSTARGIRPRPGSAPPAPRSPSGVSPFAPATGVQEARSPLRGGSLAPAHGGGGYSSPGGGGWRQATARSPVRGLGSGTEDARKGLRTLASVLPPPPEINDAFEQVCSSERGRTMIWRSLFTS